MNAGRKLKFVGLFTAIAMFGAAGLVLGSGVVWPALS